MRVFFEISLPFSPDTSKPVRGPASGVKRVSSDGSGSILRRQLDVFEEQSIGLKILFEDVPPISPTLQSLEVKVSQEKG